MIRYKVMYGGTNIVDLERNVTDALDVGWECQGGVSVICTQGNERIYYQAMVLKTGEDTPQEVEPKPAFTPEQEKAIENLRLRLPEIFKQQDGEFLADLPTKNCDDPGNDPSD